MSVVDAADLLREAEIQALALLDQELPDVLTRLARAACAVTGASNAEINVISANAQHTVVSAFGSPGVRPVEESFCAQIVREQEPVQLVPDARQDPRFARHEVVTAGKVLSYAASRLVTSTGVPIGTLCVFDATPRSHSETAAATLAELGSAVVEVLETRRGLDQLQGSVAALAEGQRELRRSNESLAAFAGQVAHDIQGPLSAVLMSLELLGELTEEERSAGAHTAVLDNARSAARRVSSTVAGLLDFAVLGGRLEVETLDMDSMLADVLTDLAAKTVDAEVVVEPLPSVCGDPVQVRAVLQNLLTNALKYGVPVTGRPVITVTGSRAGDVGRITVRDRGPGVEPEQRRAIFEDRVRGVDAAGSDIEGLGIGLATCARVVAAHGGALGVEDAPGGGAAFWFELPVRDERPA